MSPRLEREAAMDDMAAFAQAHRFAPIVSDVPDPRAPTRVVPTHIAARAEPPVLTLPTPALLAEVHDGLALRVCRQQTTARDVLLVQALEARLRTAACLEQLLTPEAA